MIFRRGRGRSLRRVLEELRPVLRGWMSYYRKSQIRITFEELDQWIRRKLRPFFGAVEAELDPRPRTDATRTGPCPSVDIRNQRAWSLVECRRKPHEPSRPDPVSAPAWSGEPHYGVTAS